VRGVRAFPLLVPSGEGDPEFSPGTLPDPGRLEGWGLRVAMRRRPCHVGGFWLVLGLLPGPESMSPLRDVRRARPLDVRFSVRSQLLDAVSIAVSVTRLPVGVSPLCVAPPDDPFVELHQVLHHINPHFYSEDVQFVVGIDHRYLSNQWVTIWESCRDVRPLA
jgi:hypothetical protein